MFLRGVWGVRWLLILVIPLAGARLGISQDQGTSWKAWTEVATPSPAADITAVGNTFWICGADEMIASSSDGGATWAVHHQAKGGKILLHLAFINEKVGHAAGKGGLLLSTVDGGSTWVAHTDGDDVWAFSFGDANNGIAVIGGDVDINRSALFTGWGDVTPMDSPVRVTHDGGEHWEDIPVLSSGEFAQYKLVLAVAALDSKHFLMLRRQPNVADVYVISEDGGKSWKIIHPIDNETNRELPRRVFAHDGEYWAFGMELVHREKGGGYGVPMVLHSKDGTSWTHGASGKHEFGSCNPDGCNFRDGLVETLYGSHEQYWAVPQDGSLTNTWAMAGDRLCTIGGWFRCATVQASDGEPSETVPCESHLEGKFVNLPFAKDCVACAVRRIPLDPGMNWQGRVVMSFRVEPDGSVSDWFEDGAPDGPLGALIEAQFKNWKFAAPGAAAGERRHVAIDVKCVDEALVPTMDGCELKPADTP